MSSQSRPSGSGAPPRGSHPRRGRTWIRWGRASAGTLAVTTALGCFKPDDGREPPLERIYFPTGLALSADGSRLYVANSNWDLQFNAGSVQAYDADAIRSWLPRHCQTSAECGAGERCQTEDWTDAEGTRRAPSYWCVDAEATDPCGGLGARPAADRFFEPGLCAPLDNTDPALLLGSVGIGAFATDLLYRPSPAGGGRLFVPVRSDATLHWIDVSGGASDATGPELDCGQGEAAAASGGGECDSDHRRGDGARERTPEGLGLPIEPYGVAANADGTAIVTTHQTEGDVALFTNDWSTPDSGPRLQHVLEGLPARPIHVSSIPLPEVARLDRSAGARALGYQPGFWVTFRGSSFIQLIRYYDEVDAPDGQPYLERAFADRLNATTASDVRSIAVDAGRRSRCEQACGTEMACLGECAGIALDVFLANRSPASLLVGSTTSIRRGDLSNDRLAVSNVVPIEAGPTRAVLGDVTDETGQPARRVLVTSFDGRSLSIYDPVAQALEARVLTGRGPTAIAIDSEHAIAYVAHFTDSYIGVVDLDRRHRTYGTMILTLGTPIAPRGDR